MSAQSRQRGRRDSSETLAAESPALLDDAPENQGRTLWLAIDFGTTYSTVAFIATYEDSAVPEPGAVKTVRNWKCLGSTKRAAAVPSLVAYRNIGTDRENMLWGFEVDAAIQRQAMRSDESDDVDNSLKGTRMERFKLHSAKQLSRNKRCQDERLREAQKVETAAYREWRRPAYETRRHCGRLSPKPFQECAGGGGIDNDGHGERLPSKVYNLHPSYMVAG